MPDRQLVSFDWALKRLLRSKANFAVLEGFLSELLRDDITITEILESESNADSADGKVTRVDMKVRDHLGRQIIIELQHTRQGDYLQRMLYYASAAVAETLPKGQAYARVERVISVNIVYFDLGQGNDYVYLGRNEFRGIHTQDTLALTPEQRAAFGCDDVAELFPEYYILRVNKFDDVARDGLDQWVYFLKNEDIPGSFSARGIREAKDALDVMRLTEVERRAYKAYQDELHQQASMYDESFGKLAETRKKLEDVRRQEEEERRQKEEERRQKEEAQRREEEERRQKESLAARLDVAIKALVAKGMSDAEARKLLGG